MRRPPPFRRDRPAVAELAAGAVLVTPGPHPRLLLIHESSEDRWCFPKGHVEPGESADDAARREVEEETGLLDFVLEEELAVVTYRFYSQRRDRSVVKSSVYFLASCRQSAPQLEAGFDTARWCTPAEALPLLEYANDRAVVRAVVRRLALRRRAR